MDASCHISFYSQESEYIILFKIYHKRALSRLRDVEDITHSYRKTEGYDMFKQQWCLILTVKIISRHKLCIDAKYLSSPLHLVGFLYEKAYKNHMILVNIELHQVGCLK